ncbi:hypothetical protein X551_03419 [Methylibium sp. T29]|nr:hypothetical protein X551_03419 [Methylibium sp. T29]
MPKVTRPANEKGEFLVDYEEKVFEDVKAAPGEKALVTFHTVAFEGSIGFVNLLQATRLQRKGFETSVLLYGPGVTLGVKRGFPTLGDEAFPGHQNFNNQIAKFIAEGGKVYACRFALQALYGHGEGALIEGIRPISPLDVLDIILLHRKADASSSTPGHFEHPVAAAPLPLEGGDAGGPAEPDPRRPLGGPCLGLRPASRRTVMEILR